MFNFRYANGKAAPERSMPPLRVLPSRLFVSTTAREAFFSSFFVIFFLPFSFFLRDRPLFFLCFSITYKVLPNIMDRGIVKEWIYSYWKRKKKKKRLEPF